MKREDVLKALLPAVVKSGEVLPSAEQLCQSKCSTIQGPTTCAMPRLQLRLAISTLEFEMGMTFVQENETNSITLEGVVDISCAAELKQALLKALRSGPRTRISVAKASWMDVTITQLLWAAEREAAKANADFEIVDEPAEPVFTALKQSGFEPLAATVKVA